MVSAIDELDEDGDANDDEQVLDEEELSEEIDLDALPAMEGPDA